MRLEDGILHDEYGLMHYSVEDLETGSANRSLLYSTELGKVVLKRMVCGPTDAWFKFQVLITRKLRDAGVDLPEVVSTRVGTEWVRRDGAVYQLRRYVDGRPFQLGNEHDLQEAALTLRSVHRLDSSNYSAPPPDQDIDTWLKDPNGTLLETLAEIKAVVDPAERDRLGEMYERILAQATARLSWSEYAKLPHCVTHGEFHGNNILFAAGRLVSLIDWDAVGIRPRVYDIARAGLFLSRRARARFDVAPDAFVNFLGTYLSGGHLLPEEVQAMVPVLQLYFLPSPRYLRLIRAFKPEMMTWYLDWSGRGAECVSATMADALARAAEVGLVDRETLGPGDWYSGLSEVVWHRRNIAVSVVCTDAERARITKMVLPYFCPTKTDGPAGWVIETRSPEGELDGTRRVVSHPPGEPKCELLFSPRSRRIFISQPKTEAWRVQNTIRIVRLLTRFQLMEAGEIMIHAGMVRYGRVGIAFAGPKKTGKTSSILAALTGGATNYVSNDDLSIHREGATWLGFGWPRSVSARKDSVRAVLAQRGISAELLKDLSHPAEQTVTTMLPKDIEQYGLNFIYPSEIDTQFGCAVAPMGPLDAIILPTFVENPGTDFAPELRPMHNEEAAQVLVPEIQTNAGKYDDFLAGFFELPSREKIEAKVRTMLNDVPCYRLLQTMETLCEAETLVTELARSIRRQDVPVDGE